jgi:predicted acyltransferase
MKKITNMNKRILSLDFFRGLTIAAMILVNTPGDGDHVYAPLKHSIWHGCTPTDLVFPFFLFMVGVSIVYALASKKIDAKNHKTIILGALRRMLILIGLGLSIFLFSRFDFTHLRFPGVLQRIGIVYFISTIIYLKTNQKTRDWLFGVILITYYLLLTFVPIPDGHAPNLTPQYNLAAWLDRAVFTTNHMYRHTVYWDPVGLLSTLPAIATALFGIRVGELLKRKDLSVNKITGNLLIVGITATVLGLLTDLIFPINKQLWTSSYVLYTGGLCTIGLTAAYWLIDVKGYKKFVWIFVVFGTNAISAYVLAEFMPGIIDLIKVNNNKTSIGGMQYIYEAVFARHFPAINASLFFACAFVSFIWLIMYIMYRNKIIIKV